MGIVACFIGHRKIDKSKNLEDKLLSEIEKLICSGVNTFLFGSKSEFDTLCYNVVTTLKEKYPDIVRVKFNTSSEVGLESEREAHKFERKLSDFFGEDVSIKTFEENVLSKKSLRAKRGAYIERNKEIIDASDFCIFYYDKNYLPPTKKTLKK